MHMIAGVLQYVAVASFAEAWIENLNRNIQTNLMLVASFAEAWIEKKFFNKSCSKRNSRLLRGGVD